MHYSPQQVRAMSMWQFAAAVEGFIEANTPDSDKGLSETEIDDLWEWIKS